MDVSYNELQLLKHFMYSLGLRKKHNPLYTIYFSSGFSSLSLPLCHYTYYIPYYFYYTHTGNVGVLEKNVRSTFWKALEDDAIKNRIVHYCTIFLSHLLLFHLCQKGCVHEQCSGHFILFADKKNLVYTICNNTR